MIQADTEVFVSVCPTNTVSYKLLSVTVGSQSQILERILQQKLNSAGPVRCDTKRKWGAVTTQSQKEKRQITSIASSSWNVLKHLSRNLSKNPYPCLHCSKLTYHIKCIHFCNSYPNALYAELFPAPHYFPPQSLQGRDLCDSTCFRRHSGITLPIGFSIARSQEPS